MFIYENGLPVAYDHTDTTFECRNGCVRPEIHDIVEQRMLIWFRGLPGQSRVRAGKVSMMQGQIVDLKRLGNE